MPILQPPDAAETQSLRVLVVEDSEQDTQLLLRQLRQWGYEVTYCRVASAAETREALANGQWHLVISDYSLPGFGAMEALRILHESGQDVPFIIVSGTIGEETAVDALKAGAHDFMVKARLARLLPAIQRELRDAESRRLRRKAEDALRASQERFRDLVESMEDLVFTLDRSCCVDGIFGRSLQREGLFPEGFLGKTIEEILGKGAAEPHAPGIARALAGEHSVYEWSIDTARGPRYFNMSLSPRRSSGGEILGVVVVAREVTEQKRVHTQLVVADRMASVGMLAAGVAHEINNPLAAIIANLALAADELMALNRQLGGENALHNVMLELQDARECADRVRNIVRDLKLFSRAQDEQRGAVDIHNALESSLRMAWNEIRHRARLVKDYQPVPPVLANESRLAQLFLNLVMNAAQAIPEGHSNENEIRIATRLTPDGRIQVEVQDSGCGMPPHVLQRLFTPFFTTKPTGLGTGLGLSICERIVSSLGGDILVHSEVGKGSVFRVYLPAVARESSSSADRISRVPVSTVASKRRGKVLLVDDEGAIVSVLERCLASQHDVTAFTSAREALQRISDGSRFDLLICDLVMPDMGGMDLHAALTEVAPEQAARMVFLTGGAFTPRAHEFLSKTPNLKLEKPFDAERLRRAVNTIIDAGADWPTLVQTMDLAV